LVEADKQIYAVSSKVRRRRRRPIAVALPAPPAGAVGLTIGEHNINFDYRAASSIIKLPREVD
jgi:hypothetical protein